MSLCLSESTFEVFEMQDAHAKQHYSPPRPMSTTECVLRVVIVVTFFAALGALLAIGLSS